MATKFFVDGNGKFLGGFDGAPPPVGAIEVPSPPSDGRDTWSAGAWVPDAAAQSEAARLAAIDAANGGFSHGGRSLAELKAMTNAQFDTWWGANVTNAAQAIVVLKLLARAVLRRVL